jgi:phage gp36-like protein
MPYATTTDFDKAFGVDERLQRTDRNRDGSSDTGILEEALARADREIDDALRARYDLPLAAVPASLKDLSLDIARYYLYDDEMTEVVEARYKSAVARLRQYSTGASKLDVPPHTPDPNNPNSSSGDAEFTAPPRLFSRGAW